MLKVIIEKRSDCPVDSILLGRIELELSSAWSKGVPRLPVCHVRADRYDTSAASGPSQEFDILGNPDEDSLECCKEAIDHLQAHHGWTF